MPGFRYEIAGHRFESDHVLSAEEAQQLLSRFGGAAEPPAPPPTAAGPQAPSAGPRAAGLASDVLQVGVPLALRAAGMVRNPLALAATALISRALPALVSQPSPGETPRSEPLRQVKLGVPGELINLGLTAGVPAAARAYRAFRGAPPASLPAITEMAATQGGVQAGRMAGPAAAREAGQVTTDVATTFRDLFRTTMFGSANVHARRLRDVFDALRRRIPVEVQPQALQQVLDETGLDLRKATARTLRTLLDKDPVQVAEALRILGRAADQPVEEHVGVVAENLFSRLIDRALKRPPRGVAFPQAFRGGVIDPEVFLSELGALDKKLGGHTGMGAVFGAEGTKALEELSRKLGGKRLAAEFARAGAGEVPKAAPLRVYPFFLAASLFFVGRRLGGAVGQATELGAEAFGVEEFARRVLPRLASTPMGLRWIAAGADLAARGVPDSIAVPALARLLPAVVRSLQRPPTAPTSALGGHPVASPLVSGVGGGY